MTLPHSQHHRTQAGLYLVRGMSYAMGVRIKMINGWPTQIQTDELMHTHYPYVHSVPPYPGDAEAQTALWLQAQASLHTCMLCLRAAIPSTVAFTPTPNTPCRHRASHCIALPRRCCIPTWTSSYPRSDSVSPAAPNRRFDGSDLRASLCGCIHEPQPRCPKPRSARPSTPCTVGAQR